MGNAATLLCNTIHQKFRVLCFDKIIQHLTGKNGYYITFQSKYLQEFLKRKKKV